MFLKMQNKRIQEQVKTIYKLSAKLNLYVANVEYPNRVRIKKELGDIKKLLDKLILKI